MKETPDPKAKRKDQIFILVLAITHLLLEALFDKI